MFNVPSVLIVIASITLVGCAGVTSGNRLPTIFNRQVNYQAPIKVDTFQPLIGSGNHHPIADIFVQDLNSDGADEVIIGGRQSQPVAMQNCGLYPLLEANCEQFYLRVPLVIKGCLGQGDKKL